MLWYIPEGSFTLPQSADQPEEGNGNPLKYSCLGNFMNRRAWWVTVHGVATSQTQLSESIRSPRGFFDICYGNLVKFMEENLTMLWVFCMTMAALSRQKFINYSLVFLPSRWFPWQFPLMNLCSAAAAAKSLQSCLTVRPHRWQPTRLPGPWDSPGKNTGVGCHFLLQCMKVKSESEVTQSCPTLRDAMDCSLPGSSVHGIFQARVLEWGAVAFSGITALGSYNSMCAVVFQSF